MRNPRVTAVRGQLKRLRDPLLAIPTNRNKTRVDTWATEPVPVVRTIIPRR